MCMSKLKSVTDNKTVFSPCASFINSANINQANYTQLKGEAGSDYQKFWGDLARDNITWHKPFTTILNDTHAPFYKWFEDGLLNVSYNCIDRHLVNNANKIAIISEADDGKVTKVTYQDLYHRVCKFANGLKLLGVTRGDRVIIYMPHSIEAVVAMQACARIGAIHSVVFAGFSAHALAQRITDADAHYIVTVDYQVRGGKETALKQEVDNAINLLDNKNHIKNIIINRKTNKPCNIEALRDILWNDLVANQADSCDIELVDSEHPLFILYTSGSTGTPKGVQHSTAGYLLGAILTLKWVFDIKPNDIFWCTADVGWITGHTYVSYGPLALGITQVIFEGVPTYPDASRFWQIIERYKVSVFYTAPTAIRTLIKLGPDLPKQYDLSSLRLLGTVGEPINPEAWLWYYEVVGNKRCPIVDTWWQTETGANMLAPIPGVTDLKPGSCTFPIPGIMADIVDESGNILGNNASGYLVIRQPFPFQARTIWGNNERFISAYYPSDIAGGKYYVAGDSAHRDDDGYFWILGRVDDVLNVSGHRLGTMEIESALVSHPMVAEAAVVGTPHDIKGEAIMAFVVCKGNKQLNVSEAKELSRELRDWVAKEISPIARPEEIRFGDNLPKTRSGKIMRRLLRSIARGEEITQDISTLENPAILEQLKQRLDV